MSRHTKSSAIFDFAAEEIKVLVERLLKVGARCGDDLTALDAACIIDGAVNELISSLSDQHKQQLIAKERESAALDAEYGKAPGPAWLLNYEYDRLSKLAAQGPMPIKVGNNPPGAWLHA